MYCSYSDAREKTCDKHGGPKRRSLPNYHCIVFFASSFSSMFFIMIVKEASEYYQLVLNILRVT